MVDAMSGYGDNATAQPQGAVAGGLGGLGGLVRGSQPWLVMKSTTTPHGSGLTVMEIGFGK